MTRWMRMSGPAERIRLTDLIVSAAVEQCVPIDGPAPSTRLATEPALVGAPLHQPRHPRRRAIADVRQRPLRGDRDQPPSGRGGGRSRGGDLQRAWRQDPPPGAGPATSGRRGHHLRATGRRAGRTGRDGQDHDPRGDLPSLGGAVQGGRRRAGAVRSGRRRARHGARDAMRDDRQVAVGIQRSWRRQARDGAGPAAGAVHRGPRARRHGRREVRASPRSSGSTTSSSDGSSGPGSC